MTEKSTRILLIIAITLMGVLLLRLATIGPVLAQSVAPAQVQPVMAIDNTTLYVLSNNKIYVYYWDSPAAKKLLPQIGKLKLMQTLDAKISP